LLQRLASHLFEKMLPLLLLLLPIDSLAHFPVL